MKQFLRKQIAAKLASQFSTTIKFKPITPVSKKNNQTPSVKYLQGLGLDGQKIEYQNISVLASKLYLFGFEAKRLKLDPLEMLDAKTIQFMSKIIKHKMTQTSLKDQTFLISFMQEHPRVFEGSVQDILMESIKGKILADDFVDNCPQIDYLGMLFFLVKMKPFRINDPVWIKLINSASKYNEELTGHQLGLLLWSLASLHQRAKKTNMNTLQKSILEQWELFYRKIFGQLSEVNLYTESLIMQSLCTMKVFDDELWRAMIQQFSTLYHKSFDEYSVAFGLWSIATYSKSHDYGIIIKLIKKDLRDILDEDQLTKFISSKADMFTTKRLLMTLWGVQQLGYGSDNFWNSIYTNKIRLLMHDGSKILPNDVAVIVQILSKQQVLNESDWQTCEEVLINIFQSAATANDFNEKSLVNIIQAFSIYGKGSDKFWITIENHLIENQNSIQPRGLAIILYSFIKQINVQAKTISWIIRKINVALQDKNIQVAQLAHILQSMTHFQQHASELDETALKQIITNDFLKKVKPKDISQLVWSFGFLKLSLDSNIERILHDNLLISISNNEINQSDANQLLKSIGNVFQDKTLLQSILDLLKSEKIYIKQV